MPDNRRVRATAVGLSLVLTLAASSVDYTVKRGDTLARIAKDQGVSISELVDLNGIENPNLIYPGQVLVIPGEVVEPGETELEATVYVVARGDTLARIAKEFGTSVTAIVEANGIANPNYILVGQQLTIPGRTAAEPTGEAPAEPADQAPAEEATTETQPIVDRSGRYHIVAPGERLGDIAAQYEGISAEQIAAANGIIDGVIYAGTRLFLDGPAFVAKGMEGEVIYTVVSGDRLGDIAAENGVSVATIVELNNITDANLIRVGQQLSIPSRQQWVCPVTGTFFNDWGFPRGGGTRWHNGTDVFVNQGTPVYASVPGTVQQKVGSIGGNQVNLYGDDGVVYITSHLSAFGESGVVKAGEIIGYVGTSGSAKGTRPHVHLEMHVYGEIIVNPYPSLVEHRCKG